MERCVKTILLLLLLTAFSGTMSSQKKFRKYWITGSSMFVSGMLDGTIESLVWHYERGFKTKFPHANDQYWNPAISWQNKYKNGNASDGPKFAGSTNVFAFTTDAYHLLRSANRTLNTVTLAYYINGVCNEKASTQKKWKTVAKDFLILTLVRSAGFTLTYNVVFRKVPN